MQNIRMFFSKKAAVLSCLLMLGSSSTNAAPVLFNFDEGGALVRHNFVLNGVTFSPECHIDLGEWMGFDGSGCHEPEDYNQDYLGTKTGLSAVYIAPAAGHMITLKSFDVARFEFQIRSSRGGYARIECLEEGCGLHYKFTGPEWTNLKWLEFHTIGGIGDPVGLDNLALNIHRVDEPSSIALLGLSMLGLMGSRARGKLARSRRQKALQTGNQAVPNIRFCGSVQRSL